MVWDNETQFWSSSSLTNADEAYKVEMSLLLIQLTKYLHFRMCYRSLFCIFFYALNWDHHKEFVNSFKCEKIMFA